MRFTTRVELHSATDADYTTLHGAMERQGFSRLITDAKGVRYQLPLAEYNYEGDKTSDSVLAAAAALTRKSHAVLVTEANLRKWDGLTPVK